MRGASHAEAWRLTFDELVHRRIERTQIPVASFSVGVDYPRLIHGKARVTAVHVFLASRGVRLPEGSADDPPGVETVNGLANRKSQVLMELLERGSARAFQGARLYLELARDAAMRCAVVSGSTSTQVLLERAHLATLIDACVDGNTARSEHLRRKPEPDMLLAACRHLGVGPERTVVFETTAEGIDAARAGGFEMVVAVERAGQLRGHDADLAVSDLSELLERQLVG